MMHLCLINLQKNIMYILPVLSSKCLTSLILQQSTLVWITWCPITKSPLPHSKAQLPHMSALETKGGRAIAIVGRLRLRYRLRDAQYIHCRLHQQISKFKTYWVIGSGRDLKEFFMIKFGSQYDNHHPGDSSFR